MNGDIRSALRLAAVVLLPFCSTALVAADPFMACVSLALAGIPLSRMTLPRDTPRPVVAVQAMACVFVAAMFAALVVVPLDVLAVAPGYALVALLCVSPLGLAVLPLEEAGLLSGSDSASDMLSTRHVDGTLLVMTGSAAGILLMESTATAIAVILVAGTLAGRLALPGILPAGTVRPAAKARTYAIALAVVALLVAYEAVEAIAPGAPTVLFNGGAFALAMAFLAVLLRFVLAPLSRLAGARPA